MRPDRRAEFLDSERPVVLIHVDGRCEAARGGSRLNAAEAVTAAEVVRELKRLGVEGRRIGVIAPYRAQRARIREELEDEDVEVGTVDSYQGREKDVIVFSVTATGDLKFVANPNRLNVAFTRAREKLVVLGNAQSIAGRGETLLAEFLRYVDERRGLYDWGRRAWTTLEELTRDIL